MDVLDVVVVVIGLAFVALVLVDAFDTLLATNLAPRRWSPSLTYFAITWRLHAAVGGRLSDDRRRERWLGLYGPASFIGLLLAWTAASLVGWALVWWGLRSQMAPGPEDPGEALYFAGVAYFSVGFGDLLPGSGLTRLLTVLCALDGLGTLGLVIGYLPSLSAAYKEREVQVLLLDDLTDARITPVSLIASRVGADGDTAPLEELFREWERWCAAVFESHSSLPMLVTWRSKHRGHSWITALGVVTDAAIDHIALVPGTEKGPAMRLYRQSVRLVSHLTDRFGIRPVPYEPPATGELWEAVHDRVSEVLPEVRPLEESRRVLHELRADFHPHMEAFIDVLVAPRGFWGVTAADHLAEVDLETFLAGDLGGEGPLRPRAGGADGRGDGAGGSG